MGLHRTHKRKADRLEALEVKAGNRVVKTAERKRRDARMLAKIKGKSLPYAPSVMSWLSRQLDKSASKITAADVKKVTG